MHWMSSNVPENAKRLYLVRRLGLAQRCSPEMLISNPTGDFYQVEHPGRRIAEADREGN